MQLTMLAQKRDEGAVVTPDNILDARCRDFSNLLSLLDIVQYRTAARAQNQGCLPAIKYLGRLDGWFNGLLDVIREVADLDEL